jgi:capsular polysaccharide biosynthesis protein
VARRYTARTHRFRPIPLCCSATFVLVHRDKLSERSRCCETHKGRMSLNNVFKGLEMTDISWKDSFVRRWKLAAMVFAVTAVVCWIYLSTVPKQWEATATVQIGQIGQQAIGQQVQLVESASRVFERVKTRSFKDSILKDAKLPSLDDAEFGSESRIFGNSLNVKLLSNPDLIEIKVRALSPDQAATFLQSVVGKLKQIHDGVAFPTASKLRASLQQLSESIKVLESERLLYTEQLAKVASSSKVEDFLQKSVYAKLLSDLDLQLRTLQDRKLAVEEQLSPSRTYSTSILEGLTVSKDAVAPLKLITIIGSFSIALILAILLVFSGNIAGAVKTKD